MTAGNSAPSGADGLRDAIADAECVKNPSGKCGVLQPAYPHYRHPECAAAAAVAWFTDLLDSVERYDNGGNYDDGWDECMRQVRAELGGDQRETGEPT